MSVLDSQYSAEKKCHILFQEKWYVSVCVSACFSFVTIEQYKLVFISQKLFVLFRTIDQAQKGSGYDLMEAIDLSLHISTYTVDIFYELTTEFLYHLLGGKKRHGNNDIVSSLM